MSTHTDKSQTVFALDATRVATCRKQPDTGPRIVFFSGGTALRGLSRALTEYTHNSVHLITPFDSGGSSAHLRRAFHMPSVGDLRNRLLSLASPGLIGSSTFLLYAHRLSTTAPQSELSSTLQALISGEHDLIRALPPTIRPTIQGSLGSLAPKLPDDFDLRGASIGNLLFTASYLAHDRDVYAAIDEMGRTLDVLGTVCPIADTDADLAATLADGSTVVGQHLLTGKEAPPLVSPIVDLFLVNKDADRTQVSIGERAQAHIATADLICFPMGSFHTSIRANLLPTGVGRALRDNPCTKVYVPNTGHDPEQIGLAVDSCVDEVIALARSDAPSDDWHPVDLVLLDESPRRYEASYDEARIAATGAQTRKAGLVTPVSDPCIDHHRLAELLISLTRAPDSGT